MSTVSEICPDGAKTITLKILTHWRRVTSRTGHAMEELILCDLHGVRIHASIKQKFIKRHDEFIIPGRWIRLQNFRVEINNAFVPGDYYVKTTPHRYMILFTDWTETSFARHLSSSRFYIFSDFGSIGYGDNNEPCVDLIGEAVNVLPLRRVYYEEYSNYVDEVRFELKDHEDNHLECVLLDEKARFFTYSLNSLKPRHRAICLFRWWKIVERGGLHAEPAGDFSEMLVNADNEEIHNFRERLCPPVFDSTSSYV